MFFHCCGANECLLFIFLLAFLVYWRCLFLGVAHLFSFSLVRGYATHLSSFGSFLSRKEHY